MYVKKEKKRCFYSQTKIECVGNCVLEPLSLMSKGRFISESGNSNVIGMRSGSRTREYILNV